MNEPEKPWKARGRPLTNLLINSIGMEFVLVSPGRFHMGSPEDEKGRFADETMHEVKITRAFYLQSTTVTQKQWELLMEINPSCFVGDSDLPVEFVSWMDAQAFIAALNKKEGVDLYHLPSEAEWEYVCRAGSTSLYSFGYGINRDCANYKEEEQFSALEKDRERGETLLVKSFPPNDWGLYQMHGNVWEWCQDWYKDWGREECKFDPLSYDPLGPAKGAERVVRGGSWDDLPRNIRSASRSSYKPDDCFSNIGFRVARSVAFQYAE